MRPAGAQTARFEQQAARGSLGLQLDSRGTGLDFEVQSPFGRD
jgi:hypothetical protein